MTRMDKNNSKYRKRDSGNAGCCTKSSGKKNYSHKQKYHGNNKRKCDVNNKTDLQVQNVVDKKVQKSLTLRWIYQHHYL